MNTRWFSIATEDDPQIADAAQILRDGGLLAIPTETVYGLGANGLDEQAVLHIFEAKGRPQDNPLILHVPDAGWLDRCCEDVPESAYALARRFWPGPLTMILKKKAGVPLRTTGGLDTVGVRCPDHAVTRAIIAAADVPVAAPSANTSGRPSCTSAADVREDMWGKIDGIVDGGACAVGVESTIIDLTGTPPQLLRPGGLPLEALQEVLGTVQIDRAVTGLLGKDERPRAPGMKYRHYAPKAPVTVVTGSPKAGARYLLTQAPAGAGVIVFSEFTGLFADYVVHDLGASSDKGEQARRVFDALRSFDATGVSAIYAQCPDTAGLGLAVANRLQKAAGFQTVAAPERPIVIGITGGTGAGKTSFLRAMRAKGACVLDCDAVYHEMLQTDAVLRGAIAEAFGGVFGADGALDRKKMGDLVFGNAENLARLDAIVAANLPRGLSRKIAETDAPYVGIDAVKLIESGLSALCDTVVSVIAPEEVRLQRIVARDGISPEYAKRRIDAQQDEAFFRTHGDYLFENLFPSSAEAEAQAAKLFEKIIGEITVK